MSDYGNDNKDREELYSVRVRAGKRTYFFDVKETRGKDLYMTITESKRSFDNSGNVNYAKHKLFLYREDFEKFEDGFIDATDKIKELMASGKFRDPIAERKAHDEANPTPKENQPPVNSEDEDHSDKEDGTEDESNSDKKSSSEDEVKFDDL
jgi:hypothetical protein